MELLTSTGLHVSQVPAIRQAPLLAHKIKGASAASVMMGLLRRTLQRAGCRAVTETELARVALEVVSPKICGDDLSFERLEVLGVRTHPPA